MGSVVLLFISMLEVIAGALVYFHWFPWHPIFTYMSIFYLLKGIWSIVSSIASGFFYDWMGALDFITGIALMLIFYGTILDFFWIIGVAHILKGLYSLIFSL